MMKIFMITLVFMLIVPKVWGQSESGSADDTPVLLDEIAGEKNLTGRTPWVATDFSNQQTALGWGPHVFDVPKGLEINCNFWLDIYTKYTTDQGLLHDAEYIDLIYEVLDFTHISVKSDLSESQKSRLRSKAVKDAKKRIVEMLRKLQNTKDPSQLSAEEKRVWDYFQKTPEKNKISQAAKKNRLRFQLGQRDRMVQGIFFAGRYLGNFEQIFRNAGLPIELTRLPFVESSFNVLARSKVGASGLWQIMRYTGRPYMMINNTVDKRNLPDEATKLAAKLMRINYNLLESWPLAITGYNHGPAGVLKLTKIYKSRELGDLIQNIGSKKRLGFASRNFYASFLAVLEAERNANKYFGQVYWSKPLDGVEIIISKPIKWKDVLRWFDGDDKVAQIYNPHIMASARKFGKEIPKNALIYVPADKKDLVQNEFSPPPRNLPPPRAEEGDLSSYESAAKSEKPHSYKVISGDNWFSIARDFGVTVQELLDANKLKITKDLRVGQELSIP